VYCRLQSTVRLFSVRYEQVRYEACVIRSYFPQSPYGGGFEYLQRSPARRRRRRKENPVPGGITGPPCSWGMYIREPGPPGWRVSNLRQLHLITSPAGLGPRECLRWRRPAAVVNDRAVLSSERAAPINKPVTV
jgi:hypothetical protein